MDDKVVWGQYVSLQHNCDNIEEVCVSIFGADFYFRVFI